MLNPKLKEPMSPDEFSRAIKKSLKLNLMNLESNQASPSALPELNSFESRKAPRKLNTEKRLANFRKPAMSGGETELIPQD